MPVTPGGTPVQNPNRQSVPFVHPFHYNPAPGPDAPLAGSGPSGARTFNVEGRTVDPGSVPASGHYFTLYQDGSVTRTLRISGHNIPIRPRGEISGELGGIGASGGFERFSLVSSASGETSSGRHGMPNPEGEEIGGAGKTGEGPSTGVPSWTWLLLIGAAAFFLLKGT